MRVINSPSTSVNILVTRLDVRFDAFRVSPVPSQVHYTLTYMPFIDSRRRDAQTRPIPAPRESKRKQYKLERRIRRRPHIRSHSLT